jgi:hypothetical protein
MFPQANISEKLRDQEAGSEDNPSKFVNNEK